MLQGWGGIGAPQSPSVGWRAGAPRQQPSAGDELPKSSLEGQIRNVDSLIAKLEAKIEKDYDAETVAVVAGFNVQLQIERFYWQSILADNAGNEEKVKECLKGQAAALEARGAAESRHKITKAQLEKDQMELQRLRLIRGFLKQKQNIEKSQCEGVEG